MTTTVSRRTTRSRARVAARTPKFELVTSNWQPPTLGDLTFTDIFCGAGGSSLGLTHAGMQLKMAANHWRTAINTHASNFRDADHRCANVNLTDFRTFPKTNVLWASPICTEMSPAGGGKSKSAPTVKRPKRAAVDGQGTLELEEYGHIAQEGYERTRATFWDVIRATEVHRYDAIIVENVPDVAEKWELFRTWLNAMVTLGYNYQLVSANSAHIGGDGIRYAPQWRDRLYIVFTRIGVPLPDVDLRPVAHCFQCGETVKGVQTWCKAARGRAIKVGRYRRDPESTYGQYWYTCPNVRCRGARVEPYVLPAQSAIDWSDPGQPIHMRTGNDVLSPNTVNRIKSGLMKYYVQPMLATVAGNTYERPGSGYVRAYPAAGAPMPTQTTTASEAVVTPPDGSFYTMAYSAEAGRNPDRMNRPVSEPFGAMTTTNSHGVVTPGTPFTVNSNHDDERATPVNAGPLAARTTKIGDGLVVPPPLMLSPGGSWADEIINATSAPMRTQTANPKGFEAIATPEAFITVLRNHADAERLTQPFPTMTTGSGAGGADQYLTVPPGAFHIQNYGGYAQPHQVVKGVDNPFGPITTKDHHALVVPYQKGQAKGSDEPFSTMMANDTFALLQAGRLRLDEVFAGIDLDELVRQCHYRMLKPRESLRAQRFDEDYVVTGNIGEQTMQAGNAVSCNAAEFFGRRVAAALCQTVAA